MIIDGRTIAKQIDAQTANEVSHLSHAPHMTIFTCAPDFATQKYLMLKKKKADTVGIEVNIIELPETLTTQEVVQSVQHACLQTDAIIVQLPLPPHINVDDVLQAIPKKYDADGMHYDGTAETFMSPVVASIADIAHRYDVSLQGKKVTIVGKGRLVGAPSAVWAQKQGAQVTILTVDSEDEESAAAIADADILILGAGVPALVTPEMVKQGVVIFDAGTSEDGGVLRGDAHPDCARVASLFTPVPGGIGPMTISVLLKNVVRTIKHSF